jgi:hypothetical protein
MSIMISPIPGKTFAAASGTIYTADQYGIMPNVAFSDIASLTLEGCSLVTPATNNLLAKLLGANFNSTADQLLTALQTVYKFRVTKITIENASLSLTTAAGGFYTGAGKTGDTLVAAGQLYSALTTATVALDATLNLPNKIEAAGTPIYLSLTTAQGATCTADVYVWGDVYS